MLIDGVTVMGRRNGAEGGSFCVRRVIRCSEYVKMTIFSSNSNEHNQIPFCHTLLLKKFKVGIISNGFWYVLVYFPSSRGSLGDLPI